MRIKYTIICLLASMGIASAQFQNYVLQTPDNASKTYVGRDYVRLLPGYSFSASSGKAMNAKVSSTLTAADANTFLAAANPTGSTNTDALTAINTSLAVGQIPISSSVSPTGAKCYNVPIDIVPGRQGFQPNISLSYNSQAGNGVVGMGWNISGLSSIERVNKNIFFDGMNQIAKLSSTDAFTLDGVRLIEKSRTTTQIEYETVQGNIKVTATISNDIVNSFKVLYSNGTYGTFNAVTDAATAFSYPISILVDLNGNRMYFTYTSDNIDLNSGTTNKTYYADEISYGHCQEKNSFAKIKFVYESRPDQIFSLQAATSMVYRQRLSRIESYADPDLIRTYTLSYSNTDPRIASNQNDVSRLTQVNCSAGSESLNPLKFYYGENDAFSIVDNNTSLDYSDLSNVNFTRGKFDVNPQNDAVLTYPKADFYSQDTNGLTTLVYPSQNSIKIFQNIETPSSKNYELPDKAEAGLIGIISGNIDGDNTDEIIKINSAGIDSNTQNESIKFKIYKALNSGGAIASREINIQFTPYSTSFEVWAPEINPKKFYTGDFTGHGFTEILINPKYNQTNACILNLNNSSSTQSYQLFDCHINFDDNNKIYPADVDGDGQTEIIYVTDANTVIYKYKENLGLVPISTWNIKNADFTNRYVSFNDINGDGNIDVVISPKAPSPFLKKFTYSAKNFEVGGVVKCPNCGFITDGSASNCQKEAIPSFCGGKANYRQYLPAGSNPVLITQKCVNCNMNFKYNEEGIDHTYCVWCNQLITKYSNGGCSTHGTIVSPGMYSPTWKKYSSYDYDFQSPNIYDYTYDSNWRYLFTDGVNIQKDITVSSFQFGLNQNYFVQDVDGDNVADLIVNDKGNISFYPFNFKTFSFDKNSPFKFTNSQKTTINSDIIPIDINANNKSQDFLFVDRVNGIICVNLSKDHTKSNQISLMTNSLGVAEKTSYDQLYQGANYTPGTTATFPNTDFQGPLWITTQTSDMYNKQLISNTTYNYTGAIMHEQGLGLRGFTSTKVTDMMTNKVTTTTFDPYKMGVVIGQSSDNTESSFKYNFTDYDSSTGGNKKMKLLLTNKIVTDKLKGNTVTVSYPLANYDSYGNPGREITDFGDGITSTVVNNFENRIGTVNLIGLLTNKVTTNVRDGKSFNQTEGYEYDTNNRLHYVRKYIGSKMLTETEYKYTAYGTVSNETMHNIPTNDYLTTSYTYDNDQYLLKTKTDPQGLVTTYTNNLSNRLLVGITDYLGKTVTYGYDNWRRKNYELRPDGTTTNIIWAWNPDSSQKGIIMETQASLGQPATMLYTDALGREARKAIIGFDGTLVFVDKAYDNFGRLASTSAPYKSGSGALLTTYAYDEYNRAKTIVQPSGSTTSYSYSGNSVTENKDGVSVTKTTDATGKLVSSQDAGGTITYAYRPDGQPDNVNAAGVVTSFEYTDDYNRQTKLIDPSAGTIGTIYDDANHMVTQTWNSGKQIKTVSNKFGQPVSKVTPDFTTTYGYENGKLKTVNTNNGSSKSFNYDGFGRLSGFDDTFNGKELYQQYTYELGRLKNVTYYCANYFSVNYKYNSSGYLYRLEDGSGNRLREINSVDATGQETSVLLGNGLTTTKNYTPEGLETNVTTSNNVQNMSFDFNRITGTLNSRTDNVHGLSESFTYDGLYRLKNYGSRVVGYDSNGNILSKTDAGGYIYNRNKPYTLDSIINANADLTSQLNVDYTVMSRPTSIRNTTGLTATFGYNDDYNRTYMQVKQDGTETMSKYYLGGGRYEIETAGGVEKQRLYLDGSPYTASLLVEKVGGNSPQLYFLHRDYLGSITQVTDNNGNLAAEYSYDAWGRMRNPANWNVYSTTAQPTPMFGRGYTGHEHLNQFGIINMNARLYDPLLARFLAPDPQVSSPEASNGYNRYMYALDNPMMYTDINGEEGGLWWGGNNNNYPAGPYRPDYNPNPGWGTGQSFYNPYGGPDSGYQGSSYSGYQGGYYGGGGSGELAFLGPLIYSWLNSQNGSNRRPQMKLSGDPTTHSYIKGSPAPAPAGLGSPRVSSGGGNRRGNMSSSGGSLFNGEIKPFQPNIFERISTSGFGKGIIGKVLYGIADDLWMTACCFTIGHERAFHLSGAYAISDETVTSGINTMTNFVPIGSYGKFASIGEKTLNAGQFNALMKGSGITAATNAGIELRLYNFTVRESNNISSFWNYFGTTSTISTYLFTSK